MGLFLHKFHYEAVRKIDTTKYQEKKQHIALRQRLGSDLSI